MTLSRLLSWGTSILGALFFLLNLVIFSLSRHEGLAMQKIYIVHLTNEERETCLTFIKKLKDSSQKVRRTHILLKADADAFLCSRPITERTQRLIVGVVLLFVSVSKRE